MSHQTMKRSRLLRSYLFITAAALLAATTGGAEVFYWSDYNSGIPPVWGGTVTGSAGAEGGYVRLTNTGGSLQGTLVLPSPGKPLPTYNFYADIFIGGGSNPGADGMCIGYGNYAANANFGEQGQNTGLELRIVTYTTRQMRLCYNGAVIAQWAFADGDIHTNSWVPIQIMMTADGRCTVYHNRTLRLGPVAIPGWAPQSAWRVAIGARTGGNVDNHRVDNVRVTTSEPFVTSINRASANPVGGATSSVNYTVTLSEPVNNLGTADFNLTQVSGTPTAVIASVSAASVNASEAFTTAGSGGIGTLAGLATVSGGVLHLTEATNGQAGWWYHNPGKAMTAFHATFSLRVGGGSSADGCWFGYGPQDTSGVDGSTTGFYVVFDSYDNGGETTPDITVRHNNNTYAVARRDFRGDVYKNVSVTVTTDGLCTVIHDGTPIFVDLPIGTYTPQASWRFGFGGFTGGANDRHYIDNYAVTDNAHTVTLNTLGGQGQLRMNLNGAVVQDKYGANITPNAFTTGQAYDFDFVAPTVTINQAAAQADPASAAPINFTIVFNEAVNPATFTNGDVAITGTTGGVKSVALSTSNNITWNAAVSGMTSPGVVIANIAANAATDVLGNNSQAATFTDNEVTWDPPIYTVTFDPNLGNPPSFPTKDVYAGDPYGTLPTVTRADCSFNGWFTAPTGGSLVTDATTVTNASNHTLYAQWTITSAYCTGGGGGAGGGGGGGGGGRAGMAAGGGGGSAGTAGADGAGQVSPPTAGLAGSTGAAGANGVMYGLGWTAAPAGGSSAGGGAGGAGGVGGAGGAGGTGALGAGGGGSFVLSAKGLLRITGPALLDVSAAPAVLGGAGGNAQPAGLGMAGQKGGVPGAGGAAVSGTGSGGPSQSGKGGSSKKYGDGTSGGVGGTGGAGGIGGVGGSGGRGGFGTPGMVKLHGSVVQASAATFSAQNVFSQQANQNGACTIVSNMTASARNVNKPTMEQFATPNQMPVLGAARNDAVLTRPTNAPYETAGTAYPLIPTLEGGPYTYGWCVSDYWNKAEVESAIADKTGLRTVLLTQSTTPASVFEGYSQFVMVNYGATALDNIAVKIGTSSAVPIQGSLGTPGRLEPGQAWTTTVVSGTVVTGGTGVAITGQPTDQTVNPGATATFTVTATGSDINYQWRRGADPIPGATGPSYSFTAQASDDGAEFRCHVTNPGATPPYFSEVLSDAARLAVNQPVTITTEPVSQSVAYQTPVTFTVAAGGTPPFSYEWEKDGVALVPAQTGPSFTIASAVGSDAGVYRCAVRNVVNPSPSAAVYSAGAALTVLDPGITSNPSDLSRVTGQSAVFTVLVNGSGALSYQWEKSPDGATNWTPVGTGDPRITGADTYELTVSNCVGSDAGYYRVQVTGAGVAVSGSARLQVSDPAILVEPLPQTVDPGQPAVFTVTAGGTPLGGGDFGYQWYKGTELVTGAVGATYTIPAAVWSDAGNYRCLVTGLNGTIYSNYAPLAVRGAPITLDPQKPGDAAAYTGDTVVLEVSAGGGFGSGGAPVFGYQWWFATSKAAAPLSGETGPVLTLSPVGLADAGEYYCVVSDDSPYPAQSRTALVQVAEPLAITVYPQGASKNVGETHTMTVATSGGLGAVTYTWKRNGTVVASGVDLTSHTTPPLTYPAYDNASYVVEISDESTRPALTTASAPAVITLLNVVFMPALGMAGLGLLAAACALGGARVLRGRK